MTAPTSTLRLPSAMSTAHGWNGDLGRFTRSAVRDGTMTGLTLGVALAAALAGASLANEVVLRAVLAAVATGAIAIGFGAYLNARGAARQVDERAVATRQMAARSSAEPHEVVELLARYGIEAKQTSPIVAAFARRPSGWRELAAHFEGREANGMGSPLHALSVTGGGLLGGLVPLLPFLAGVPNALATSSGATFSALLVLGYFGARASSAPPFVGAVRAASVGALAAAVAFVLARAI